MLRGLHASSTDALDLDRVYPYLVTAEYPDALATPTQSARVLGHGLSLALVSAEGSPEVLLVKPVTAARLDDAGLDLDTAYARAAENLSQLLARGEVALELFEEGQAGAPWVVVSGHWLAAATLAVPSLYERMVPLLGNDIVAAVPARQRLFLFGAASSAAMTPVVDREFHAAAKPLTTRLFSLTAAGPAPLA